MQITKALGWIGLLAAVLVGMGEYYLHYSSEILKTTAPYSMFLYVPVENLSWGHFFVVIGLPLYFAGYIHLYHMLESGNRWLARLVLALGIVAFSVGGIWIGSRAMIGQIVHLESQMQLEAYQALIAHYDQLYEVLVKALRVVVLLISVSFVAAILKGGTRYRKWMALFNPIVILLCLVAIGFSVPAAGKHFLPILMNVTHFILFSVSLYQVYTYGNKQHAS